MEIDRRNFIKLAIGGAAAIPFTPIPMKLTDDLSIWTQNWPWVPVPPAGEFTKAKSVCKLCPGGCGIEVRKVNSRAVKIEGREDYPVNQGGICPIGVGGLQLLYNESIRNTSPMKSKGARGSGQYEKITWDEAYAILSERIKKLRSNGTPQALAAIDGNSNNSTSALLVERLLKKIGSPNYIRDLSCESTYSIGNSLMQGPGVTTGYDLEGSDFILSFGCGLLEGWLSAGRVLNAWGIWHELSPERNAKIVQIESRASNTASKADQWIAPKPGSTSALALAIAHVLIKENLYNKEYVENNCHGFNNIVTSDGKTKIGFKFLALNKYAPSQVAGITGLDPEVITTLARSFGKAKAPVAIYGSGKGSRSGSLLDYMAINSLNALMGINRPGGMVLSASIPLAVLAEAELDDIAKKGLETPRIDQAGTAKYPLASSLINNFAEIISKGSKSAVDTLMIFSSNPAFTLPDGGAFRKALENIPFVVSFSPYKDETTEFADLILPDHTYLEKIDDVVSPTGLQYPFYGVSKAVVEPLYDTRNTIDVIIQLANTIGDPISSAFPWENAEEVMMERAKGLFDSDIGKVSYNPKGTLMNWGKGSEGLAQEFFESFDDMWEKIKSTGMWYRPFDPGKESVNFKTASGKFEFLSSKLQAVLESTDNIKELGIHTERDEALLPHYEIPVGKSSDSLTMVPFEMVNLSSTWIPSPPFAYNTLFDHQLLKKNSFIVVNPETAKKHGFKEGEMAIVKSSAGEIKSRVNLFDGAMPGIVFMPLGFGHTAYDEFSRDKGVNPNDIIVAGKDPLSGDPVWWETPVQLIKA